MPRAVTIDEAQAKLKELIHQLAPGEEVVITENQQPVAKLVNEQPTLTKPTRPGPGLCKGMITYMAHDFDAPRTTLSTTWSEAPSTRTHSWCAEYERLPFADPKHRDPFDRMNPKS